jgi:hypothetical protein
MSAGAPELHAAALKRRLRELPPAAASPLWMVYFALGALVLLTPLLPLGRGFAESAGFLRVLSAFAFFILGALSRRLSRLQSQAAEIADLVDALARERYGADYYAVRVAVSALIADLPGIADATSRGHVVKALQDLTGEAHGDDPAAWSAWWLAAKASFDVAARQRVDKTSEVEARQRVDKTSEVEARQRVDTTSEVEARQRVGKASEAEARQRSGTTSNSPAPRRRDG